MKSQNIFVVDFLHSLPGRQADIIKLRESGVGGVTAFCNVSILPSLVELKMIHNIMPSTDLVYSIVLCHSKLWQIKSTKVNVPKNCQKKRLSLNNIYGQSHDKWETKRRCVIRPKVVMSLCDEHNLNRIYSLQFDNISTFGR